MELGPLNISSRWEGLPESIDEAYTRNDGKTVFFSAKQYVSFKAVWVVNIPCAQVSVHVRSASI